jgi:hypothetical protein
MWLVHCILDALSVLLFPASAIGVGRRGDTDTTRTNMQSNMS